MTDVTEYKKKAMIYSLNDELLVKALTMGTTYEKWDSSDLIWEVVFPYLRLDETQEEVSCNLLFEVNEYEYSYNNMVYKDMELVVCILCHKDSMRYTDGTRTDYISGRVDYLFNKNPNFGSGRLALKENKAYVLQSGKYHYRTMIYATRNRNNIKC